MSRQINASRADAIDDASDRARAGAYCVCLCRAAWPSAGPAGTTIARFEDCGSVSRDEDADWRPDDLPICQTLDQLMRSLT